MLVLARKRNESIEITGPAKITILQTGKVAVRLGIDAPAGTKVIRSELEPDQIDLPRVEYEFSRAAS